MSQQISTIVAAATALGGAIAVIRLSGPDSRGILERVFDRPLHDRQATFGSIRESGTVLDEVVVTDSAAPGSYTGEDSVEISCHGSAYLTGEIIRVLLEAGATMAAPGEFTLRAFLGGKLDLSQAEAVADLIASNSRSSARVAMQQMRGGYSEELRMLSSELLNILSLLELELDFGEEDVEFADRTHLLQLIGQIHGRVSALAGSFQMGNVLKNGVPVAIIGKPNVGKSTLLNRLLGENRSIVSPIAGTTRDYIEELLVIDGISFRLIDTAGLRSANDEIERIGIERSYEKIRSATIVLQMVDSLDQVEKLDLAEGQIQIVLLNKVDIHQPDSTPEHDYIPISAKYGQGIDELKSRLGQIIGITDYDDTAMIVTNARHYEALEQSRQCFERAIGAIESGLSTDMICAEIRSSMLPLGEITGQITTDDILGNIFSKFCIGK